MADIALRFGSDLKVVIEQNRRRSSATLRILRLSHIQRWPEGKMKDWPCYFLTGPKVEVDLNLIRISALAVDINTLFQKNFLSSKSALISCLL